MARLLAAQARPDDSEVQDILGPASSELVRFPEGVLDLKQECPTLH